MKKSERKIRVLVGKPGLDGHDRGVKVVAAALRDAGMEVIYSGLHQTPEMIVETAIQEDVDVIGLSVLSGAHMTLFRKTQDLLAARGAENVILVGGGIIPQGKESQQAGDKNHRHHQQPGAEKTLFHHDAIPRRVNPLPPALVEHLGADNSDYQSQPESPAETWIKKRRVGLVRFIEDIR